MSDLLTQHSATPIIQLWGHLLVPLQGDLSDAQAARLRDELLRRIQRTDAATLVLDVSGLEVLDSHLCSLLASIAAAARLMGLASIICGLSAEIVMTLQEMGIELSDVDTALTLEVALESLGVTMGNPNAGDPGCRARADIASSMARSYEYE